MSRPLRMDEHSFSVAVSGTRLGPRAQKIGRAVLVRGEPQTAVAKREGVTKQRANEIVHIIVKNALKLGPCPMCGK